MIQQHNDILSSIITTPKLDTCRMGTVLIGFVIERTKYCRRFISALTKKEPLIVIKQV